MEEEGGVGVKGGDGVEGGRRRWGRGWKEGIG